MNVRLQISNASGYWVSPNTGAVATVRAGHRRGEQWSYLERAQIEQSGGPVINLSRLTIRPESVAEQEGVLLKIAGVGWASAGRLVTLCSWLLRTLAWAVRGRCT